MWGHTHGPTQRMGGEQVMSAMAKHAAPHDQHHHEVPRGPSLLRRALDALRARLHRS